ncbi:MAG: hypothetical protein AseanaTS_05720 [Candidatus Pelagadaptatus aseana]|uniref:DUF5329 family protein n=1 Tax=Candidatus Pelagadaptatus aseana TaxID=3120508 RepID=UPI0039B28545
MMYQSRSRWGAIAVVLLAVSSSAVACSLTDSERQEIHQLIAAIEQSQCVFVRNNSEHDAEAAADHLRLKLKRGSRYISDSETFIERLASKSSWSGKPYAIRCPGQPEVSSASWLLQRLEQIRSQG